MRVEKHFVPVTNQLTWAQLESEDYKTYIERLRAVGCPEETIRDIIVADLDKLMAPQVQALHRRYEEPKYWQSEEEELLNDVNAREVQRKEREIEQQKRAIIRELIQTDLRRERIRLQGQMDYYERRLSFLPEERRTEVRDILEQYDEAEQAIRVREWDEGEPLTPAEQQKLRQLRQRRQAELAQKLTPAEQQQYELWMSPAANGVRFALYGMNASEQEFLAVYQARKTFEDSWGSADALLSDDAQRQQMEQDRQRMEEAIRQQLGEQRYSEYKRGEDADWHHLCALTTRFQLPREKAIEVYGYKGVLRQVSEQVLADANLGPQQKAETLQALARETASAVSGILGERAFGYYRRTGQADWIGPASP